MLDPVHWTLLSFGWAEDAEDGVRTDDLEAGDSGPEGFSSRWDRREEADRAWKDTVFFRFDVKRLDMSDLFETPLVRIGVPLVVLCVLIAAGFYLVSIFRDYAAEDQEDSSDVLSKLEEMHRKGDISDQEFRTIQARTHRPPAGTRSIDDSTSSDGSSTNPET